MSSRSYIKESLRQYKEQLEQQKKKGGDRPAGGAPAEAGMLPGLQKTEPKAHASQKQPAFIEDLVLKVPASQPRLTGRQISVVIALNHRPVRQVLEGLREKKLVVHHSGTAVGDFKYELSMAGRARATERGDAAG